MSVRQSAPTMLVVDQQARRTTIVHRIDQQVRAVFRQVFIGQPIRARRVCLTTASDEHFS